jgi:hypothetical protein
VAAEKDLSVLAESDDPRQWAPLRREEVGCFFRRRICRGKHYEPNRELAALYPQDAELVRSKAQDSSLLL